MSEDPLIDILIESATPEAQQRGRVARYQESKVQVMYARATVKAAEASLQVAKKSMDLCRYQAAIGFRCSDCGAGPDQKCTNGNDFHAARWAAVG